MNSAISEDAGLKLLEKLVEVQRGYKEVFDRVDAWMDDFGRRLSTLEDLVVQHVGRQGFAELSPEDRHRYALAGLTFEIEEAINEREGKA